MFWFHYNVRHDPSNPVAGSTITLYPLAGYKFRCMHIQKEKEHPPSPPACSSSFLIFVYVHALLLLYPEQQWALCRVQRVAGLSDNFWKSAFLCLQYGAIYLLSTVHLGI